MQYKLTLLTDREVVIREMKISDYELAANLAGARVKSGNQAHMQIAMQSELVKLLLVSVEGKELSAVQKQSLDELLSVSEYSQLIKFTEQFVGEAQAPKVEMLG